MKKFFLILFVGIILFTLVGCKEKGDDPKPIEPQIDEPKQPEDPQIDVPPVKEYSEGLSYELSSDGTYYNITGIGTCTDTLLNIKNTYNDLEVKNIVMDAFVGETIEALKVPESINIEKGAFKNCNALTDIQIGKVYGGYLGYIFGGNQASNNAQVVPTSLKNVVILNETDLLDKAFTGCNNIESITLNDEIKTIGNNVFYNCEKLKDLTFPKEVKEVYDKTFYNCFGLENIYYNGTISSWLEITFPCFEANPMYYATNFYLGDAVIEELVIPEGTKEIGNYQFAGFGCVKNVTINSDIETIGEEAFYDMTLNTAFNISDNSSYQTIDGILFNGNVLISYALGKLDKTYMIKNNITEIKPYAFYHAANLENITFEEESNVTTIGKAAFANCTSLKGITIPETITRIEDELFMADTNITTINLPKSITYIGVSAFESCTTIEKIVIPLAVTTLREYAFRHCENLTIYCEIDKAPKGWTSSYWNVYPARPVVWSYTEE